MQSSAMAVTCTLPHRSLLQATKLCHPVMGVLWAQAVYLVTTQSTPITPGAGTDGGSGSSWGWGHTTTHQQWASAMSYFSRAATSRGPEIPVLIKSCIFYYAAQLIHADYCSFTSLGLSPHSLKYVMCQSDRALGGYSTQKPELG